MSPDAAQSRLRDYVTATLGKQLDDSDNIFVEGEASSLYSIELVMFFEEHLGIELDDRDLDRANFDTLKAMSSLIERKLSTDG